MPTLFGAFSQQKTNPCWKRGNLGRACSSQHLRLDSKQFDLLLQRLVHLVPIRKKKDKHIEQGISVELL